MTVIVKVGRRVPRNTAQRVWGKIRGLLTFQENIWLIIKDSFNTAKKKASKADFSFVVTKDSENEDLHWKIEWIIITINGTRDEELDEYNGAMSMWQDFKKNKMFNRKITDSKKTLGKAFKTDQLTPEQVKKCYEKGYGAVEDNSIHEKLLEVGIMTHVEKDWDDENEIYN